MWWRSLASGIIGIVLAALPLVAQNNSTDAGTKFSSSTELVLVPTVVTDGSGNHVANLKKEDFVLKEDGKPRSISIFEEVTTDTAQLRRSAGEKGQFSNFEPGSAGYHRLTIIVL